MEPRRCAICGRDCEELELAFRLPDAVLAVPDEEREVRVRQTDDFVAVDGVAFFIRCVAPIPVQGREEPYGWGLWVKVSESHFQEYLGFFRVDPPVDHPGFQGTIANQTRLLAPTLGQPVHVHLGRGMARPRLMLLDDAHPLAARQTRGITPEEAHAWSDHCAADVPVEPPAPWFTPALATHGWRVATPEEAGRPHAPPAAPIGPGDRVKAPFVFLAADPRGDVVERTELMWIALDEVRADGWWSGTLDDEPSVPGPFGCGSRVWLRAEHVLAVQPAPVGAASADAPPSGSRERIRRRLSRR